MSLGKEIRTIAYLYCPILYTYDAYGNILSQTNSTLAKVNPYRYRGYRYDEETRLYYLQSRYYNPETGRFINADGMLKASSTVLGHNMFAYTENNPVMNTDPTGYCSVTDGVSSLYTIQEHTCGSGFKSGSAYFSTGLDHYNSSISKKHRKVIGLITNIVEENITLRVLTSNDTFDLSALGVGLGYANNLTGFTCTLASCEVADYDYIDHVGIMYFNFQDKDSLNYESRVGISYGATYIGITQDQEIIYGLGTTFSFGFVKGYNYRINIDIKTIIEEILKINE